MSTFYLVLFCSHISWLLTWIQGIYLNKNACPRYLSWCVSHIFENNWVYLFGPSVRGVWVNTHKTLAVFKLKTSCVCVVDPHYSLCCCGNKPVVWFLKVQIHTNAFHIRASLLHLEFTFWWLKVKNNNNKILFWRRKALQSKRLSPMCVQVNIHI